jgi:hypothetical protein
MAIRAGWRLRVLYVKGMIMIIAAGGAVNESLERRLMKEANSAAGRWLENNNSSYYKS